MTTVTGATSAAATQSDNALNSLSSSTSSVDFNTFLTLLTTQLKNQDPLNPAEGTEFTAQIAQFSQLEQQVGTNEYLKQLVDQTNFNQQALAVSYMGKEVLIPGDRINLGSEGDSADIIYELSNPAAAGVTLEIKDESGAIVRTITSIDGEDLKGSAGTHVVSWDGLDDAGETVPVGNYQVTLSVPTDVGGATSGKRLLTYGEVNEVESSNGQTVLKVADGRVVQFDDVITVRQGREG